MKETILNFLWPKVCPFCEKIYTQGICENCKETIKELNVKEPYCLQCGKPIVNANAALCKDCQTSKRYFNEGRALWCHTAVVRKSIYRFKYYNQRDYGLTFAKEMSKELKQTIKRWNPQVIIPVPLCQRRRRERGFNQALILAKQLGETEKIPVREWVSRIKETSPQKELDKKKRKKNIEDAFLFKAPLPLQRVLLIDDIFTSGSTINEIAKTLKKQGVLEVYFITISIGQEN